MPRTGAEGEQASVHIRSGTATDSGAVARLHAAQISQGFLSLLGPGFLARLYRRILHHPTSFLVVAEGPGRAVGFIAGSTDVAALYRSFLWRDGVMAGLGAARHLIPRWRRVAETLRHGTSGGVGRGRGAELLAVAVDGPWAGRGIGGDLVAAFLEEATARGATAAHVVVAADNGGAVSLYRRAGFVITDRFELHAGTVSLLMQWDRPEPDPAVGGGPP